MSPDEVPELTFGGADDQTDSIPTSSSSDSLSMSDEIDARVTLPTPSDILVSYSTFPGVFVSECVYFIYSYDLSFRLLCDFVCFPNAVLTV